MDTINPVQRLQMLFCSIRWFILTSLIHWPILQKGLKAFVIAKLLQYGKSFWTLSLIIGGGYLLNRVQFLHLLRVNNTEVGRIFCSFLSIKRFQKTTTELLFPFSMKVIFPKSDYAGISFLDVIKELLSRTSHSHVILLISPTTPIISLYTVETYCTEVKKYWIQLNY